MCVCVSCLSFLLWCRGIENLISPFNGIQLNTNEFLSGRVPAWYDSKNKGCGLLTDREPKRGELPVSTFTLYYQI